MSFCSQGEGCLPDRDPPSRHRPPWIETPLLDRDSPLYDKERAVRILLECILVHPYFELKYLELDNNLPLPSKRADLFFILSNASNVNPPIVEFQKYPLRM